MIRFYSDALIVLEKSTELVASIPEAIRHTTVIAEEVGVDGKPDEMAIHFYGKGAEEANEKLVPGIKFTCRGFIKAHGEHDVKAIARAFATFA